MHFSSEMLPYIHVLPVQDYTVIYDSHLLIIVKYHGAFYHSYTFNTLLNLREKYVKNYNEI